jgi:hypothetical protein
MLLLLLPRTNLTLNGANVTTTNQIDIADLDCIYLSYDEPNKEEHWVKIKNMVPWARRIDGIKGSDAAHKAAAAASDTERFILIDGDNIPDAAFFNQTLTFTTPDWEQAVFRWRARNHINGLMYGNGGLSSWTREFVNNMRTHEATDGRVETEVEFCFDPLYWPMYDCYSTTYPNGSPFQAWRAGFREGVKMCLNKGAKPTVAEFQGRVHQRNLDHLTIWHNVGVDVENGHWAMAGARQGTYMTMLTNWDHRQVQDFDELAKLWDTVKDSHPRVLAGRTAEDLFDQLNLPMANLESEQSKFFKQHYRSDWRNRGIMVREMDVIRQQEGW